MDSKFDTLVDEVNWIKSKAIVLEDINSELQKENDYIFNRSRDEKMTLQNELTGWKDLAEDLADENAQLLADIEEMDTAALEQTVQRLRTEVKNLKEYKPPQGKNAK